MILGLWCWIWSWHRFFVCCATTRFDESMVVCRKRDGSVIGVLELLFVNLFFDPDIVLYVGDEVVIVSWLLDYQCYVLLWKVNGIIEYQARMTIASSDFMFFGLVWYFVDVEWYWFGEVFFGVDEFEYWDDFDDRDRDLYFLFFDFVQFIVLVYYWNFGVIYVNIGLMEMYVGWWDDALVYYRAVVVAAAQVGDVMIVVIVEVNQGFLFLCRCWFDGVGLCVVSAMFWLVGW